MQLRIPNDISSGAQGWHRNVAVLPEEYRPMRIVDSMLTSGTEIDGSIELVQNGDVSFYFKNAVTTSINFKYQTIVYVSQY